MSRPIYLDNHATTAVDPRVLEAMLPYFCEKFGNAASSSHQFGWEAAEAVEVARREVAALCGARPDEIVFTSGATESDNLALKGLFEEARARGERNHLITTTIEHPAILDTARRLEHDGAEVTYLPVSTAGLIDLAELERAIRPTTFLISIIAANNEIGTVQPLAAIGDIARRHGVPFHTDAAQALGRIPFDRDDLRIDLASFAAHKLYGPKGIGALLVRRKGSHPPPRPRLQMEGGGHEHGLRSGTLAVPNIVGFGRAAALARAELASEVPRLLELRARLERGLTAGLDAVRVNGDREHRLPGNLNMTFDYVEGEALITGLTRIAVSAGSACGSTGGKARKHPSHVLAAIGLSVEQAHSTLRFGIGRFNTEAEIDQVVDEVTRTVRRLREISPLYDLAKRGSDPRAAGWIA